MQMAKTISYVALAVCLIGGLMVSAAAQPAGDKADHIMVTPEAVQWVDAPPSLPSGAKWAVLEGDPPQAGPFTFRVKVPAGFKMPPHKHPNLEHVAVLSGVFHFGMGEQLDETNVKPMPAGSFVVIPTGSPHYFVTKDETVLQVNGIGPWGVTYVNSTDDPRQRTGQR
jgi:quercetin dioxygenase-like cupin family protein